MVLIVMAIMLPLESVCVWLSAYCGEQSSSTVYGLGKDRLANSTVSQDEESDIASKV